jgi:hypothetical protein
MAQVHTGPTMRFAYYERLSAARQRVYRDSDAIEVLALPPGVDVAGMVGEIRARLAQADRSAVERGCRQLVDRLAAGYGVPPVRVVVLAQRPADDFGELHGLYEPAEGGRAANITVWMRTARRDQVVAFKSFVRTLVHELGHHLDYELFNLPETFHTEGFYKRESTLAKALFALLPVPGAPP